MTNMVNTMFFFNSEDKRNNIHLAFYDMKDDVKYIYRNRDILLMYHQILTTWCVAVSRENFKNSFYLVNNKLHLSLKFGITFLNVDEFWILSWCSTKFSEMKFKSCMTIKVFWKMHDYNFTISSVFFWESGNECPGVVRELEIIFPDSWGTMYIYTHIYSTTVDS